MVAARRRRVICPQPGPQARFVSCPANEVLFGGARGGGKSYGMLIDWCAHEARWGPAARGILFRRTLREFDNLKEKCAEILPPLGWGYSVQNSTWHSPRGAFLRLRYLDRDAHAANYQGHEYTWLGVDEAGSFPSPAPIDKLRATLRSAAGVTPRMVLTANPGGVGHNWIKGRYIDPVPPMRLQRLQFGASEWTLCFIPSKFEDNIALSKADPGYIDRIVDGLPDWLAKAWRDGNWDIIAGGMFDDVWDSRAHVVRPFTVPPSWRVDRSFDWGSSRPFSVGWWAESDGSDIAWPDGETRSTVRGDLFRIAEWYGWNGRPNEGCRMLATEIAKGIKEREAAMGLKVRPGPADSSIFDVENGRSINDDMAGLGVSWDRADKSPGSRKTGAEQVRKMLRAAAERPREAPGLFVFETCRQFIRTVPTLPRSEKDIEDIDTTAEDHIYDETRYRVRAVRRRLRQSELMI